MKGKMEAPGAAPTATEGKSKAASLKANDTPKKLTRQQKWRTRNPAKYLCHITVANALRLGVLKRQPCAVCGDKRTDAHHPDYTAPLHVEWLCRRHHRQAHARGAKSGT